jgi:hypothetical protein
MRKLNLVICMVVLVWASSAIGATLNVPSLEYPTIQAAIEAAVNGDVVVVADGTYTGPGNRDMEFLGKAITVSSQNGPGNCIIDCQGSEADPHRGFYFRSGEDGNSVLNGFTITNGVRDVDYWPDPCGGAIYCYLSSPTLMNCTFTGNTSRAGGAIFNSFSSPTVANCTFSENTALYGGGMCNQASNPIVTNCIFTGNSTASYGGGIYNYNNSSLTLANCTFSENTAQWLGGAIRNLYSTVTLTNCILWGDAPPEIDTPVGTVVITYSNVEGGWAGEGNIDADPCFVSGPLGDFYLSQTEAGQLVDSPCVDAGSDLASVFGLDQFTTRTDNVGDAGIVDMGYHVGDWSPPVEPEDPVELVIYLAQDVIELNLQQGIENSLDAKLSAAMQALDDINENNDVAAVNNLEAFINAVEAQRGNRIPEADADALIADVLQIINLLSAE